MIKLLKYLASNLQEEDLYNLAVFLSDNPDIIDQETLLHIIHEVNDFENTTITVELDGKLEEIKKHFEEMDKKAEIRQNSALYKLLKDNNIGLN